MSCMNVAFSIGMSSARHVSCHPGLFRVTGRHFLKKSIPDRASCFSCLSGFAKRCYAVVQQEETVAIQLE